MIKSLDDFLHENICNVHEINYSNFLTFGPKNDAVERLSLYFEKFNIKRIESIDTLKETDRRSFLISKFSEEFVKEEIKKNLINDHILFELMNILMVTESDKLHAELKTNIDYLIIPGSVENRESIFNNYYIEYYMTSQEFNTQLDLCKLNSSFLLVCLSNQRHRCAPKYDSTWYNINVGEINYDYLNENTDLQDTNNHLFKRVG
jgi:hypothetical protein